MSNVAAVWVLEFRGCSRPMKVKSCSSTNIKTCELFSRTSGIPGSAYRADSSAARKARSCSIHSAEVQLVVSETIGSADTRSSDTVQLRCQ